MSEPAMKYEHGTHAAYVIDRCRCEPCRQANRDYERARASRIEPAYVSAGPARAHVRELMAANVGLKTIAKRSGVPHGTLSKLIYGDSTRGMAPSKRIRKSTNDKLLSVTPADRADGAKVDATETWTLINEMVAAGVPKVRIAEHIGQSGALQLSRNLITARNARGVAELHSDWKAGRVSFSRGRGRHASRPVAKVEPAPRTPGADISDLLLDLAEIVEERRAQPWRSDAACRGRPVWLWFPARGDTETLQRALKVCRSCLVREQCRAANLDKREGVYGATTAKQRRDIREAA